MASTVYYYDVLNVSNDCTIQDLKLNYRKLVKEYHPNKQNGDSEMFELVTEAYNVLINPTTRKEYDRDYAILQHADKSHFDLRAQSQQYYTSIDKTKPLSKEDQKKEFDRISKEMDTKHRIKADKSLTERDAKMSYKDMKLLREQSEIENSQEQLFDPKSFDHAKFNEAFDRMFKESDAMVPHVGNPMAFEMNGSMYSSIESYDQLYDESSDVTSSILYSSIKETKPKIKLTREEIEDLKGAEYTKNFDKVDQDYNKSLDQKMRERDEITRQYDSRQISDYDTDPNCGGYGILNQIGIDVSGTLDWDNTKSVKDKYAEMMSKRRM